MRDHFPAWSGDFPAFLSHLKWRHSPQERREELQLCATFPRVPQISPSIPEEHVFPGLPRISRQGSTHTKMGRGTALWESLLGKPRWKASRVSHRSLDQGDGTYDTAATAPEKSARSCPYSSRGPTSLWRLQKYPRIHVSTGEESSGSGPESTQGLRHRQIREWNRERPPSNTHGD